MASHSPVNQVCQVVALPPAPHAKYVSMSVVCWKPRRVVRFIRGMRYFQLHRPELTGNENANAVALALPGCKRVNNRR